jgi:hypothetical protein
MRKRFSLGDPFTILIVVAIVALVGLAGIVGVFLSAHPYFNPLQQQELPEGWVDANTYVSPKNFTIHKGETIIDTFDAPFAGGQSIMILTTQVISIEEKGEWEIKFNGISLGVDYVKEVGIIEAAVASCCFVSLVQAGTTNVVEITSQGFEGTYRYVVIIPK